MIKLQEALNGFIDLSKIPTEYLDKEVKSVDIYRQKNGIIVNLDDKRVCFQDFSYLKTIEAKKSVATLASNETNKKLDENETAEKSSDDTSPLKSDDNASLETEAAKERVVDNASKLIECSEEDEVLLYGKELKKQIESQNISSLITDSKNICIVGQIFSAEVRETKDGKKNIFTLGISDNQSAIYAKVFDKIENCTSLASIASKIEKLDKDGSKEYDCLKIVGDVEFDDFMKCDVITAKSIYKIKRQINKDTSEVKRVEMRMHTQMSQMAGIRSVQDILNRAIDFGHKAIAITDKAVVQAFPAAMSASNALKKQGKDIKIIYGLDCNIVNDTIPILKGKSKKSFDGAYIVFDLETTGLSASSERITEIGAVLVKDGKVQKSFHSFVNPEKEIPAEVTKLTGITNEMVKNAPSEKEALLDFISFCKENEEDDIVLVAHNADFDTSFIRQACTRQGISQHSDEKSEISFPFSYLDTLRLSRAIIKGLSSYSLDKIASHLNLSAFDHHRADEDARILADIFVELCYILKNDYKLNSLENLNTSCTGSDVKLIRPFDATILVKNQQGLKNLYKLVSFSNIDYYYYSPKIPKTVLNQHRDNLLIGSGCNKSYLYELLRSLNQDEIDEEIRYYDYIEVEPPQTADEKDLIIKLYDYAKKQNKMVVATSNAYYLESHEQKSQLIMFYNDKSLRMSRKGERIYLQPGYQYYKTTDELLDDFKFLGKDIAYEIVVTNSNKLADMIEPISPIPEGFYPPHIDGAEEDLINITMKKAYELYGNPLPEIVKERLDKELNSITKHGFSVLYISAQKLVKYSVDNGYSVGSRGSVGSSLVATMAGISEVNPLIPHYYCPNCQYTEFFTDNSVGSGFDLPNKDCPHCGEKLRGDGQDIPFETFLGFDGDKTPDIDLNFSGEFQSNVHRYTEDLFGKEYVFKAGTIGTLQYKSAIGYVKKFVAEQNLHMTPAEMSALASLMIGVKRTTGQHPGGMVVVPSSHEIYDFCPVQRPANDQKNDNITTHFDFHSIDQNILKLDELGHDVPTILNYLEKNTKLKIQDVPMNDSKVKSLFTSPNALGVTEEQIMSKTGTYTLPELGTDFVRRMLIDANPKTFNDMVQISGLSHGTNVWKNNAEELIKNKTCTIKDVIGTRDSIMTYLLYKGLEPKKAFDIMEITRKGKAKAAFNDEIIADLKEHNVPDWYIESCKKIEYMFPKAHACAYMIAAFRMGYYKIYYPLEFYASYFTVRGENIDATTVLKGRENVKNKIKYIELKQKDKEASPKELDELPILYVINEAFCRNIKFLTIDLYKSQAFEYVIEDNSLRLPLISLEGIGDTAAKNIAKAREQGAFANQDDLQMRCDLNKISMAALDDIGCFKGLPKSAQMSMFDM